MSDQLTSRTVLQWLCSTLRTSDFGLRTSASLLLALSLGAPGSIEAAPATLVAWGGGQTNTPVDLSDVTALSVSMDHSLALKSDGTVVAWGNNFDGQCDVPAELGSAKAIAAGAFFSVAVRQDGTVAAWGDNQWGQLQVPASLTDATAVSAGRAHALALRSDGSVVAWGSDIYGQCNTPPGLGSGVKQVLAEWNYSAALKQDGRVVAWGVNDAGQTNVPAGLNGVVFIDGAESYCLAVKSDGSVVMWGRGPSVPGDLNNVVAVGAGDDHAVALKSDGSVVAWGGNQSGQLNVPGGLSNVEAVNAGWNYSAALKRTSAAGPLRLSDPVKTENGFSVSVPSQPGVGYTLEYRGLMHQGDWMALPKVTGNGQTIQLTDPTVVNTQRFYRVRQE